jgi:endonuclease/exonuclease/phosphatase family metal-dependent hydrolase
MHRARGRSGAICIWQIAFCLLNFEFCIASAACAVSRAPAIAISAPDGVLLAVVSWNLHGGAGDVDEVLEDLRSGALTGQAMKRFVLLLQEARRDSITDTAAKERLSLYFAPSRDENWGNVILSTFPLSDGRIVALPRERQLRVAAVATIDVDGERLLLVNVHLENRASWMRGALPGDSARTRQMRALLDELPAGRPGILGGDFNTWFGARETAYQLAAERFPDARPPTPFPTFRDRLPLDHLFFTLPSGWRAAQGMSPRRYGSDHNPVVGVVARTIGPT